MKTISISKKLLKCFNSLETKKSLPYFERLRKNINLQVLALYHQELSYVLEHDGLQPSLMFTCLKGRLIKIALLLFSMLVEAQ